MASIRIHLPFIARFLVGELSQLLNKNLGAPMSIEVPDVVGDDEEGLPGKAKVHFPRAHFALKIVTSRGHYGQQVSIAHLKGSVKLHSEEAAAEWIQEVARFAGPIDWTFESHPTPGSGGYGGGGTEHKLRFTLSGVQLMRLGKNASSRRNGIPVFAWDDPADPYPILG